jgi:hypothetical protein
MMGPSMDMRIAEDDGAAGVSLSACMRGIGSITAGAPPYAQQCAGGAATAGDLDDALSAGLALEFVENGNS